MFRRKKKNSYEIRYTKNEMMCSRFLKGLEKKTFNKVISTKKCVDTSDYSDEELEKILNYYYQKCIEMYKHTIYYLTLDFFGESISFYSHNENDKINHKIVFNDRVSNDCKINKSPEYYNDKECSICYEKPDMTLKCGHDFHNSCLIKYIKTQRAKQNEMQQDTPRRLSSTVTIECPLCRSFIF